MRTLVCLIAIWSLFFATSGKAEQMRVVFINPGFSDIDNPTGGFWNSVSAFMEAAAKDLDIGLEIVYCDRNHIKMRRMAAEVVSRPSPPDYLIVVNEKLSAESMVADADRVGVKVFVILNRFEGSQYQLMGPPRTRYTNWLGSLIPDNRYAGYQIAKLLIEQMLKNGIKGSDGRYHLVGFSGDYITQASIERV